MSKKLTDKELAEIVHRAVNDNSIIDCMDSYTYFIEDLAGLITSHFGGDLVGVDCSNDRMTAEIEINECVPADGWIYKDYDKNVVWQDGVESVVE